MSNCFKQVAEGLNVQPLLTELEAQPELWNQIVARQEAPGFVHGDTEAIVLRWSQGQTAEEATNDLNIIDYPAAFSLPAAVELVKTALSHIPHSGIGRILIVNLKPGGKVLLHRDEGVYAELFDRFHVALQSEEGNSFHVNGKDFHAKPGELWWFNHKLMHEVKNNSDSNRLHLIIDCVAPEYTAQRGTYFQRERMHDLWEEIGPLFEQHYHEIATHQDIPLVPDVAGYNRLEEMGALRCYTVRMGGQLVGYSVFTVGPHMHYTTCKQAMQDVLFVLPAHRDKRVGYRLLKFCEDELKKDGVQVVGHRTKLAHNFGPLLEHLGYHAVETLYTKRLDKE